MQRYGKQHQKNPHKLNFLQTKPPRKGELDGGSKTNSESEVRVKDKRKANEQRANNDLKGNLNMDKKWKGERSECK